MRLAWLSALAAALCAAVPAHAQIYRCDSPGGVVEYSNSPAVAGRNCRAIDVGPITTIPAPKLPAPAPAPTPAAAGGGKGGDGFPKVSTAAQKARDDDRRRILEEELKKEDRRLEELRAEYKNGEPDRLGNERNYQKYLDRVERLKTDIARSEGNLATIRRELAAIRN